MTVDLSGLSNRVAPIRAWREQPRPKPFSRVLSLEILLSLYSRSGEPRLVSPVSPFFVAVTPGLDSPANGDKQIGDPCSRGRREALALFFFSPPPADRRMCVMINLMYCKRHTRYAEPESQLVSPDLCATERHRISSIFHFCCPIARGKPDISRHRAILEANRAIGNTMTRNTASVNKANDCESELERQRSCFGSSIRESIAARLCDSICWQIIRSLLNRWNIRQLRSLE